RHARGERVLRQVDEVHVAVGRHHSLRHVRLLNPWARLGRRGPSPATACSAHIRCQGRLASEGERRPTPLRTQESGIAKRASLPRSCQAGSSVATGERATGGRNLQESLISISRKSGIAWHLACSLLLGRAPADGTAPPREGLWLSQSD